MSEMIDVTTPILKAPPLHAEEYAEVEMAMLRSLTKGEVPRNLWDGLTRYFLLGIRPGDFLQAVLKNDLREAVSRSMDPSVLGPLILWLNNCVPSPCWGSPQDVERWITRKTAERAKKPLLEDL